MANLKVALLFLMVATIELKAIDLMDCPDPHKAKNLVLNVTFHLPGQKWQQIEQEVSYPVGTISRDKITCIQMWDLNVNETGATPYVNSGGVGYYDVIVKMISQLSEGIDFLVHIYTE